VTARGAALRVLARVVDAAAHRLDRTKWPTPELAHHARRAAETARDLRAELLEQAADLDAGAP
jgi:hypothetical protein